MSVLGSHNVAKKRRIKARERFSNNDGIVGQTSQLDGCTVIQQHLKDK